MKACTHNPYPYRSSLLGILGGLMMSENLGDVHDELLMLFDLAGLPRPEGNYIDGWTDADLKMTETPEDRKP